MDSFNDVFQEVLKYCRNCKSISEPGYNKWIKILEPMKLENNVAYLLTDSDFSRDITMNAYENLLKEAFLNTLGFEVDIKILVKDKEEVNETEEKDVEVKVADFLMKKTTILPLITLSKVNRMILPMLSVRLSHISMTKIRKRRLTQILYSTLSSYMVIRDLEKLTL